MKTCLYLDDFRIPQRIPVGYPEWIIVRNYDEFINEIIENGIPDLISFDHDLADEHYQEACEIWKDDPYGGDMKEKTGYECAKWLVNYCLDNNIQLKDFTVHSANPSGAENILSLLNNFKGICGQDPNGYRTFW